MMQRKVLITGVAGGIGSGLAKAFKEEGYYVIGLDIKPSSPVEIDLFIQFDINQYCTELVYRDKMDAYFNNHIKNLDVLINNAAVQILGSVEEITLDDWNQTLNVNVTGPLFLSKFFLTRLEKNKGCIINIASIHQQLTKKRFVSYASSKSAIVGLTKAMSVDLEGKVRVNAISPAAIDTPMLQEGFNNDPDKVKELDAIHPIKRIGKPAEVSKLAILLAEDGLGFINGSNISIDGGISNVLKDL